MSKDIVFSVGFEKVGDYNVLSELKSIKDRKNFNVDKDKTSNKYLYYNSGNRMAEHAYICSVKIMTNVLKMIESSENVTSGDFMIISLMWCNNIVSMSLAIYRDNKYPMDFNISSFLYWEEEQKLANEIINYLNEERKNVIEEIQWKCIQLGKRNVVNKEYLSFKGREAFITRINSSKFEIETVSRHGDCSFRIIHHRARRKDARNLAIKLIDKDVRRREEYLRNCCDI